MKIIKKQIVEKWSYFLILLVSLLIIMGTSVTGYTVNAQEIELLDQQVSLLGTAENERITYFETSELHVSGYWSVEIIGKQLKAIKHDDIGTEASLLVAELSGDMEWYYEKFPNGLATFNLDFSDLLQGSYVIVLDGDEYCLVNEEDALYFVYSSVGAYEKKVMENLTKDIDPANYAGLNIGFYNLYNIDEIIDTSKKLVEGCNTDEEKIRAICAWFQSNIAYDYEFQKASYTAEGTFANRRGVCQGQSLLCEIMMRSVGIPCCFLDGYFLKSDGYRYLHAWNMVYCNGSWRFLDITNRVYGEPIWKFGENHYVFTDITFTNRSISIIEWEEKPTKTTFQLGEEFSCDGKLKVTNVDNYVETFNIPVARCSGYDTSKLGKQTVTVSVAEQIFTYEIDVVEAKEELKKGDKIEIDGISYMITNQKKKTLEYIGNKQETKEKITIPDTVKIQNVSYTVTSISEKAFYGNKYIKTVTLNKHMGTIGAYAFAKCKNLTQITIPASVRSIGKKAFFQSSKLTKVTIKTKYLTNKTVGVSAFKGTSKKLKVKVPKGKATEYKKLLKKKGASSKLMVS
ncbi:MAG: leucine-rich repeat protein [Lachnospiraceae bacterium]